jgi:hypothetical protein
MKSKEILGLIKLRKQGSEKSKPQFHCDNCNCDRFSPCTCKKSGKK